MSQEAVQQPTATAADEAVVRALYQQMMDGWNQGSGQAFAAPFNDDGDLIGFDGTHFKGRHEIVSFHQPLFDKWLKGTRLVGHVTSVRFLSPDVAVMHAIGGTVMRGKFCPCTGAGLDRQHGYRGLYDGRHGQRRWQDHHDEGSAC